MDRGTISVFFHSIGITYKKMKIDVKKIKNFKPQGEKMYLTLFFFHCLNPMPMEMGVKNLFLFIFLSNGMLDVNK